jgi:hypothetical protein
LVCPSGLPPFVAILPNLSWTFVVSDKEGDVPLPKKPKKNYDISHKCIKAWATQFPWAKMLNVFFEKLIK